MKHVLAWLVVFTAVFSCVMVSEARYYDPSTGRFLSEDPEGFQAGVNFYVYAKNNPVNANDPTGLDPYNPIAGLVNPVLQCHFNPKTNWTENQLEAQILGGAALGLVLGPDAGANFVKFGTAAASAGAVNGGLTFGFDLAKGYSLQAASTDATISGLTTSAGVLTALTVGPIAGPYIATGAGFAASFSTNAGFQQLTTGQVDYMTALANSIPGGASGLGLSFANGVPPIAGAVAGAFLSTPGSMAADIGLHQIFGSQGDNSSAAGGFVIYPNKPNNNMMRSVYSK